MINRDYYVKRAEAIGIIGLLLVLLILAIMCVAEGCTVTKRTETTTTIKLLKK